MPFFRPTPVFNPGPPVRVPLRRLPAGTMHGYDSGVNWKAYFDAKRAATQGKPWIVRSGAMGSFLAQDSTDGIDISSLPLPSDIGPSLSPLTPALPVDLYPMPSPIEPSIAPFNPGPISLAPQVVSAGGGVLPPSTAPGSSASSIAQILSELTSAGTSIARAATGQPAPINPLIAPQTPANNGGSAALVSQAQSLQAQANALAASNPALAEQYAARANTLLAQAGVGTSWFTQSTIISGLPNWGVLAGGSLALIFVFGMTKGRR